MLLKDVLEAIKIVYLSLISRHIFLTCPGTQSRNNALLLTVKPGVLGKHLTSKLVSPVSSLIHIAVASHT